MKNTSRQSTILLTRAADAAYAAADDATARRLYRLAAHQWARLGESELARECMVQHRRACRAIETEGREVTS